jgi:hypothetical protein
MNIANCRLPIAYLIQDSRLQMAKYKVQRPKTKSAIGNWQSAIVMSVIDSTQT